MKRKLALSLTIPAVLVFILAFQFFPPDFRAGKEVFVVRNGFSVSELAENLGIGGFLRNPKLFRMVLKITGWDRQITPGGYLISKSMSVFSLAKSFIESPSQKWIFIPEGLRKEEVAEKLKKELEWTDQEMQGFLARAKEGYLFPDTYLFPSGWTGEEAAERLEKEFILHFKESFKEDAGIVILASLVQREAASESEMPLVAGIIKNREEKGMPLQLDATLQYVVGNEDGWWPKVRSEDKEIDSEYNTYLHKGYPPFPICSPGQAALDSALNPEKTDYLYYLHDSKGQIHCAKTYDDHLNNIKEYLW